MVTKEQIMYHENDFISSDCKPKKIIQNVQDPSQ